ncbi:MAG: hypothetical protein LBP64_04655 [Tannerella sp.]|jgi:hypothetical protein|nr:hypothetical protein [Tannerella sp.]
MKMNASKRNLAARLLPLAGAVALFACTESHFSSPDSASDIPGGQGGSMARFTVHGDHLYTVNDSQLHMFDISAPDRPVHLPQKTQYMEAGVETIFSMDTLLFIGSQTGMYIYNVTREGFPQQIAYAPHITGCDPVVASGCYAYVTINSENSWCGRGSDELRVYDISDPYNPELVHTEGGFRHPRGLGVDGDRLFVCDDGLRVFDVSDPARPKWIDDLTHLTGVGAIDAYDVIPLDGTLLLTGAGGLYQFDYTGGRMAFISKIEVSSEN